ncbi:MAG TPA: hypothetical protein VEU33_21685 [Archangium sp.]|nr:hypothetical protein [Archangium sp.]
MNYWSAAAARTIGCAPSPLHCPLHRRDARPCSLRQRPPRPLCTSPPPQQVPHCAHARHGRLSYGQEGTHGRSFVFQALEDWVIFQQSWSAGDCNHWAASG